MWLGWDFMRFSCLSSWWGGGGWRSPRSSVHTLPHCGGAVARAVGGGDAWRCSTTYLMQENVFEHSISPCPHVLSLHLSLSSPNPAALEGEIGGDANDTNGSTKKTRDGTNKENTSMHLTHSPVRFAKVVQHLKQPHKDVIEAIGFLGAASYAKAVSHDT